MVEVNNGKNISVVAKRRDLSLILPLSPALVLNVLCLSPETEVSRSLLTRFHVLDFVLSFLEGIQNFKCCQLCMNIQIHKNKSYTGVCYVSVVLKLSREFFSYCLWSPDG